jgi:hypothetical protein
MHFYDSAPSRSGDSGNVCGNADVTQACRRRDAVVPQTFPQTLPFQERSRDLEISLSTAITDLSFAFHWQRRSSCILFNKGFPNP